MFLSKSEPQKHKNVILKMSKRGLLFQQGATQSDANRDSLMNFLMAPIKKSGCRLKNNLSICTDHLILGDNPLLSLIIAYKISKSKNVDKNILLYFTNDIDCWPYDYLESDEIKDVLINLIGKKYKNISDFISIIIGDMKSLNSHITLVKPQNLIINYYSLDAYLNTYFFHLNERSQSVNKVTDQLIIHQNEIKNSLKLEAYKFLERNYGTPIIFETLTPHPILISKNVYLTSHPQGWVNSTSVSKEGSFLVDSEFSNVSYGTAHKITHLREKQNLRILSDIKYILEELDFTR